MIGMRTALTVVAVVAMSGTARAETTLTVMAYNIWGGGANADKPVDETVAAIKAAGADIVAVSETRQEGDPCTAESCPPRGPSVAAKLAEALGFNYYDQTASNPAIWVDRTTTITPAGRNASAVPIADQPARVCRYCVTRNWNEM